MINTTSELDGTTEIADPVTGESVFVIYSELPAVPGSGWDGIRDGRVVNRAAWAAAGYPCQHCGIPGGH